MIATGRIDATRAALVRATLEGEAGPAGHRARRERGAAAGHARGSAGAAGARSPAAAPASARRRPRRAPRTSTRSCASALPGGGVARAGVEAAILDAAGAAGGRSALPRARRRRGGPTLVTDITLPISDPARMAGGRARATRGPGSTASRSRSAATGAPTSRRCARSPPRSRTRASGWTPTPASPRDEALALLDAALADGLTIECFEQPCAADDLAGHGRGRRARRRSRSSPTSRSAAPTISIACWRARAAQAVNLKLAKLGGPLAALALGRRARAAGLA